MNQLTKNITPETLAVADCYLAVGDVSTVSERLSMPRQEVVKVLNTPPIRRYVDKIFSETGYQNRQKLASTLDTLIDKKLQEMEETEMGSKKDVADLLEMAHKMKMTEMKVQLDLLKYETDTELKLRKLDQEVEITDKKIEATDNRLQDKIRFEAERQNAFASNYEALLNKLLRPSNVDD